jgi:hypothetical protein
MKTTSIVLAGVVCLGCAAEPPLTCPDGEAGTVTLGPAGGVVASGDAEVLIPPGAVSECQAFTLAPVAVDSLPEGGTLTAAFELTSTAPLKRSVVLRLPATDSTGQGIALLRDGQWVPLLSTPSPDRQKVWARSGHAAVFGVRARPPGTCPATDCGGDLTGTWEVSLLCSPRLPLFCFGATVNLLGFTTTTFDGNHIRQTAEVGPLSIQVPEACLAGNHVSQCAELGGTVLDADLVVDCADTGETECGCTGSFRLGHDRAVLAGDYEVEGNAFRVSNARVVEGMGTANMPVENRFCRSGNTLSILSSAPPTVNVMQAVP